VGKPVEECPLRKLRKWKDDTGFLMCSMVGFCVWILLPVLVTCPVAGFGTTNAEPSNSATRVLVTLNSI
jgi:hypothetical protein